MTIDFSAAWPPPAALASAREGRLLTLGPASDAATAAPRRPIGIPRALLLGAAFGLAWGLAFRMFMRLLSDHPEFSAGGTAFILGYAVLLWTLSGLQLAMRDRGWSWPRRIVPAALVVALIAFMTVFAPTMPLLIVPLWLALSRVRWPAALRWALAGSTVLAYAAGWAAVLMFDGAYHPLSLVSVLRATATITLATAVLAPLYFAFAWAMEPVRRTSPAIAATPSPARLDTPATATRPA